MLSAAQPRTGSTVVDFGCGSGNLLLPLAHQFPELRFVGVDLKPRAIELLLRRAAESGLCNVHGTVLRECIASFPCSCFSRLYSPGSWSDSESFAAHATSIETYCEPYDIAISLHACGPASDAVLHSALKQVSSAIVVTKSRQLPCA